MPSPARPEPRRTAAGGGLPVADSLFFHLVRLVNQTARPFVEGFARQHHLTLNEWRVLVVVATRGEANAAALALPRPLAPPVTMAAMPGSSFMVMSSPAVSFASR